MLAVLRECGALAALLPEVDALFGVPQPPAHHPRVDTGVHVAARSTGRPRSERCRCRRATRCSRTTSARRRRRDALPRHIAHEQRSVRRATRSPERLRVPRIAAMRRGSRRAGTARASRAELRPGDAPRPAAGGRCAAPARAPRRRCSPRARRTLLATRARRSDYAPAQRCCATRSRRVQARGSAARSIAPRAVARRATRCAASGDREAIARAARAARGVRGADGRRRSDAVGDRLHHVGGSAHQRSAREAAAAAPPASCAIAPWRASSSRICVDDRAALRVARPAARPCASVRCSSTWRSVSTTKPRFARSPASPAATPIANEPAYHSGIEQRRAVAELGEALLRPREMILLLARGGGEARLDRGIARDQRLRRVQRLRAHLAGVIDAHQRPRRGGARRAAASASGSSRARRRARGAAPCPTACAARGRSRRSACRASATCVAEAARCALAPDSATESGEKKRAPEGARLQCTCSRDCGAVRCSVLA